MFGMGSTGAAAASDALTLLKVLEIASKPGEAKAALQEMLDLKAATDARLAEVEEKIRTAEGLRGELAAKEVAADEKAQAASQLHDEAKFMHATAEAELAAAVADRDDAAKYVIAAREKSAAADAQEAALMARVHGLETRIQQLHGEVAGLEERRDQALADAEALESRVAVAKEAIAKLLGQGA